MNDEDDKSELERLSGMIAEVAERLAPTAPQREALSKSMLALAILFAEGRREELESRYSEVAPRQLSEQGMLFGLRDPDVWNAALSDFPNLERQLHSKSFPQGSVGEFLQRMVLESKLREESPNVTRISPTPPRSDKGT